MQLLDSLAVDDDGWVMRGDADQRRRHVDLARRRRPIEHLPTGDPLTTNICFGGDDLRTAYITLSGTGRLVSTPWPRHGLRLAHQ